jgi:type II secretion system protein G
MKRQGFTLIELLVVIAIIGVLSGIVMSSVSQARAKARDAQRISDLREIRNALELYFADHGYYPQSGCGWDCNGYRTTYESGWNILASDLSPYIQNLPKDPVNSSCPPWVDSCYSYTYGNVGRSNGNWYDLTAQFETPNHPMRCGVKNYKFYLNNIYAWCTAFGGIYSNQLYEASLN